VILIRLWSGSAGLLPSEQAVGVGFALLRAGGYAILATILQDYEFRHLVTGR